MARPGTRGSQYPTEKSNGAAAIQPGTALSSSALAVTFFVTCHPAEDRFSSLSLPRTSQTDLNSQRLITMSALPPKADMCGALGYVCFGPKADAEASANRWLIRRAYRRVKQVRPGLQRQSLSQCED